MFLLVYAARYVYLFKCDKKQNEKLCNKFKIISYPTILFIYNNEIHEFKGNLNSNEIYNFIENTIKP